MMAVQNVGTVPKRFALSIGAVVGLGHWTAQFLAWSLLPGNAATPSGNPKWETVWKLVSMPLMSAVPEPLVTRWFNVLLVANSIIWASIATAFAWWALSRFHRVKEA